jgi:hypothetical protein
MYAAALKNGLSKAAVIAPDNESTTTRVRSGWRGDNYVTRKPNYVCRRTGNYDGWERAYFREILELRDIYIRGVGQIDTDSIIYLNSPQFLYKFCKFLYKNSSTAVTRFLEPMTDDLENIYREYKEMRERINERDE